MKIETHTPQPYFQPISLVLTIETQEELDAIFEMSHYNVSIPNMMEFCFREKTIEFLNVLNKQLLKVQ